MSRQRWALLKDDSPHCIDFPALFLVCKVDSGVRRHDCVNCTHLPDICRVLSVLQVQILDPYFISDRENVDWKNVRHSLLVLLRSTPLFHRHSIFILCYLFYVHHHKKSSNHFIPVKVIVLFIISSSLYRSCIALFYRKRLPQQNGDRRIGERGTCMRLIVCGSKVGARALPSSHTR